jgi:hypothetical protein
MEMQMCRSYAGNGKSADSTANNARVSPGGISPGSAAGLLLMFPANL